MSAQCVAAHPIQANMNLFEKLIQTFSLFVASCCISYISFALKKPFCLAVGYAMISPFLCSRDICHGAIYRTNVAERTYLNSENLGNVDFRATTQKIFRDVQFFYAIKSCALWSGVVVKPQIENRSKKRGRKRRILVH